MGYFTNGFVFTSRPDFEAASKVIPGRSARGYQHNRQSVWLLDLWKPRGKLQLRRSPFCDPAAEGFRTDTALDGPTRDFVNVFEALRQACDLGSGRPEISGLHAALAVAAAARGQAHYFAADDEETDFGCNAASGSLVSFSCRLDQLSVQYANGRASVTPLSDLEDGDEDRLQDLIAAAESVAGISVLQPRIIEGGQIFYENPVGQWPQAAGDPAEILGLGTWDPLANIENDFAVVFEKLSA